MNGTRRNDPCPCGSGKKYKRCCLPKGGVSVRYTRQDRQLAHQAIEEFLDGPGWQDIEEAAEDEFWRDLDPDQTALADDELVALTSEQVFDWWLFFDYPYDGKRRVVEAFLEATPTLPSGVRCYLELARATKMWVYQVTDVRPGEGMRLRDVVTGEETQVVERSGSTMMHRWDVVATRIMPAGKAGDPVLDGGVLPIASMRVEPLIEWLKQEVHEQTEGAPGFLDVVPDIHAAWITPFEMPALVNFDGDPLALSRVYFDVEEAERVTTVLDGAKQLKRVEAAGQAPRWDWSGKGKDRKEPVLFGWFSLDGARLVFETNSAERAERGRRLVERIAKDAVKYRVTRSEDLAQAMTAMRERGPGAAEAPGSLPPELREAGSVAVEQHLSEHYEAWLDEPIPRLENMTPRKAARAIRPRMVEMLKELEAMYEKALSSGEPAFDPTWMWEELGLGGDRDAPTFRKGAPLLGHESLGRHLPGLPKLAQETASRLRRQAGPGALTRAAGADDLKSDLGYQRFARRCPSAEFAEHAATTLVNFELHLRKVFWVGESLSWMLGATKLDVTGQAVRPPFLSLALVFTDRYALGLAERMDSRLPAELRVGRMLQVLTVYVTQSSDADGDTGRRILDLTFFGDVLDGTLPSVVPCRIELSGEARLGQILDGVSPGIAEVDEDDAVRPLYESTPLRDLLALVVNALLYATSPDAQPNEMRPSQSKGGKTRKEAASILTSETVFHLPGTIDIKTLEHIKKARRGGRKHELSVRCMVRGHWRRANPPWSDQRPRWIKPHWRGPSAAAIVERQYRLEE